jgi:hypothetical protein
MKFRKNAVASPEPDAGREEMRDLAEVLSLYRSAMHHVTEREAARRPLAVETARPRSLRSGLLLAPALAAAVAAGVLVPVYHHFHHHQASTATAAAGAGPSRADNPVNIDDTALMSQIDSDLSEDVPDALQPLAALSAQSTTNNSVLEKKNATQE